MRAGLFRLCFFLEPRPRDKRRSHYRGLEGRRRSSTYVQDWVRPQPQRAKYSFAGADMQRDNPLTAKRTKASVHYSKGMKSAHCGICRHFVRPDACRLVEGKIDPTFWCRLFEKA